MAQPLVAFSASILQTVASAAPLLSAIRIGPDRHVTGLVCPGDTIVTTEQALPALDRYAVVLSGGPVIGARPGPRDPVSNLAVLFLDTPWSALNPEIAATSVGTPVLVLGADGDASPTVRLSVIHRFAATVGGRAPLLDLCDERFDQGSLVLDPDGRLIGMAAFGPRREAMTIPSAVIGRMLMPKEESCPPADSPPGIPASPVTVPRRAWLGVALQPIIVPEQLLRRAGQVSGRMVVSVTKGGPAASAGLQVGDVLLALNGVSASGRHALRAFLDGDRIGTDVEVKLLRGGCVLTARLTVADQPVEA